MNHLEKTFQDMEKNCISCLDLYKTHWTDNLIIPDEVVLLKKNDKELDEAAKIQNNTKPEGEIAQKNQDLIALGKSIYKLGRNLCHLANTTNNRVLLKIVDMSESKFISGEEKKLKLRIGAVLATAREYLSELNKYKVTAADLDGYDAQLAKLISIPNIINAASGQRKSATRTIKELNKEARVILDRLDDAFEGMIGDEKFIESWFDARKIKGRHYNGKKKNGSGNGDAPPLK